MALPPRRDAADSLPSFASSVGYLAAELGDERVRATRDTVIEKNPDADVRALALIARGQFADKAEKGRGRADYTRATEVAKDEKIAGRAQGILNEMDKLQLGMPAPEIEGNDLDGVAFKLSDYRGKVVVLDFWGDW